MVTKEDVINDLLGRSTVKRRNAAKSALKIKKNLCVELIQALQLELDSKNWQTKVELVKVLGLLRCTTAEGIVRHIVFSDHELEYDVVKREGSKALVRIVRSCLSDAETVWDVVRTGRYSITEGALEAIGYDRMLFDDKTCRSLIDHCWDFGSDRPNGYTDPRYGLAAACAGWSKAVCHDFLRHCLESDDAPLCYVAEKSLQGKYVKLR